MAKITLTLSVDDAGELQDILSQLAGYTTDHSAGVEGEAYASREYQEVIPVTPEPQPGEQSGQKRTRRTKAQIEADNAAAAGAGSTAGAATNVSGVGMETEAGPGGSGANTGQMTTDPFAEQIRQSAIEPGAATKEDVRKALAAWTGGSPPKHSAKEAVDLLQATFSVPNIGSLDPSRYGEAVALFSGD